MSKPRGKNRRRKQPIAVIIIALLLVFEVLLRLFWVANTGMHLHILENGFPGPWWGAGRLTATGAEMGVAAFRLLWALVGIVVLVGLLRMRGWSWVLLMVWVGFSLAVGVLHYFYHGNWAFSASDYVMLAADMVLAFALNQADIQRIYGIRRDDVASI
jgi:hypothetical protein